MQNKTFTVDLTNQELEFLARLIGHHVVGSAVDSLYEKLLERLPTDFFRVTEPLLTINSTTYPGRAMVKGINLEDVRNAG